MADEYPSFDDLSEFTEIDIDDHIPGDATEKEALTLLAELLPHFQKDEKLLHGYYQIIFFCLDRGFHRNLAYFYRSMTEIPIPGGTGEFVGDPTNCFVYYCIHKSNARGLAYLLYNKLYDPDEPLPLARIEEKFGIKI